MVRWISVFLMCALALGPIGPADGASPDGADSVVGGVSWICAALGILTGVSIATGNWIAAGSLVVNAIRSGCIL